jgi:CHAD domain-containing protein
MLEEERKYEVVAGFTLPDLTECVPEGGRLIVRPQTKLRATYYDTADLRLARSGASLRFRRGDDEPWTVKLPTEAPGVRNEISMTGPASTPPQRLLDLVTVYTRGAAVAPVVTLNTVRQAYHLCDRDDRVAVEVVDDTVTVPEGKKVALKFREIEVERKAGKAKLLDRVEEKLRDAGAVVGEFTPKHVRALGAAALAAPDWPTQPSTLPRRPTVADVVRVAVQRDIARIVTHDPLVRLRAQVGETDTAVHQMRVGCRRLRSDLRTFDAVLDQDWVSELRQELGWLAAALGAARDAEVLRARLHQTSALDPLAPLDPASVARIDADLAVRQEDALAALDKVMCDERYHRLLDTLLDAWHDPRIARHGDDAPEVVLPGLVGRPYRRLAYGGDGAVGAGALEATAPDVTWHAVRINGKRARYAVEAVASVLGGEATALAQALAGVQDLLGEHQDAAIAAQTWLDIAAADPDDHVLATTAGRLFERERAAVRAVRAAFPAAWRAASRRRLTEWMR